MLLSFFSSSPPQAQRDLLINGPIVKEGKIYFLMFCVKGQKIGFVVPRFFDESHIGDRVYGEQIKYILLGRSIGTVDLFSNYHYYH